jgi:UDP-N-acetylmuramate dehydrogenase
MNITEELQKLLEKPVIKNEPMAKHTNFRIGGPAKWFVEVKSVDELKAVLTFAKDQGMKTFVFGGGSNMLVNDEGFDGIAIKIAMRSYEMKGTMVKAEAGVLSSALARATANAGLAGWVWAISLPGTIGGGVR